MLYSSPHGLNLSDKVNVNSTSFHHGSYIKSKNIVALSRFVVLNEKKRREVKKSKFILSSHLQ